MAINSSNQTRRSDSSQLGDVDEIKYRDAVARAPEIAVWARSIVHGIELPGANLRKRLAGASLCLALDLYDSMCMLAATGAKSAIHVLARSVVENYARGFWLACVATPDEINRFVAPKREGDVDRLTMTLKPLLQSIHGSNRSDQSRLGVDRKNASLFDSLAHGDVDLMVLRGINGHEVGAASTTALTFGMLVIGATIAVSCVESFVREILDDEQRSLKVFEDGGILIKKTFA